MRSRSCRFSWRPPSAHLDSCSPNRSPPPPPPSGGSSGGSGGSGGTRRPDPPGSARRRRRCLRNARSPEFRPRHGSRNDHALAPDEPRQRHPRHRHQNCNRSWVVVCRPAGTSVLKSIRLGCRRMFVGAQGERVRQRGQRVTQDVSPRGQREAEGNRGQDDQECGQIHTPVPDRPAASVLVIARGHRYGATPQSCRTVIVKLPAGLHRGTLLLAAGRATARTSRSAGNSGIPSSGWRSRHPRPSAPLRPRAAVPRRGEGVDSSRGARDRGPLPACPDDTPEDVP